LRVTAVGLINRSISLAAAAFCSSRALISATSAVCIRTEQIQYSTWGEVAAERTSAATASIFLAVADVSLTPGVDMSVAEMAGYTAYLTFPEKVAL